jgi:hypothetical protein
MTSERFWDSAQPLRSVAAPRNPYTSPDRLAAHLENALAAQAKKAAEAVQVAEIDKA